MDKNNQFLLIALVIISIIYVFKIEKYDNKENFQTRLSNMKAYYRRNKRNFLNNVLPDFDGYKNKILHFFRMKIN